MNVRKPSPTWKCRYLVEDVFALKEQAAAYQRFGPYVLFLSDEWEKYLLDDFSTSMTLRDRLLSISGICAVGLCKRCSEVYLAPWQIALYTMDLVTIEEAEVVP